MAKKITTDPVHFGLDIPNTALAAIAASMAEPPFFKISMAACVASGWLVQAIPYWAITSERVANVFL
jgi:hypothetical protein